MRWAVQKNSRESGQAIILVTLAMIGLIGMLGLAIDGGDLLFRYRKAVTTVDAAALAGAVALCTGGDMPTAVQAVVEANGLNFGDVIITYPLTDRTDLGLPEEMIRVSITSQKQPYFIHIVYTAPIFYSASAITHCNTTRGEGEPPVVYFVE